MLFKDTVQRIEATLAEHPDIHYTIERRKRHPAVVLSYNGRSRFTVFSGTATERRALLNNIARLRRLISELKQ